MYLASCYFFGIKTAKKRRNAGISSITLYGSEPGDIAGYRRFEDLDSRS